VDHSVRAARAQRFAPDVRIDGALVRERLLRHLSDAPPISARVAVLHAPAGFGKTTLYAQHAQNLQNAGTATVWLNGRPEDRDGASLHALIAQALRQAGLLTARAPAGLDALLASARDRAGALALFVDNDEWLIGTNAGDVLTKLGREVPDGVHVYLAGRRQADASQSQEWLSGYLRIVEPGLLCFTADEASCFFGAAMAASDVAFHHARLEGWPAAMQFARLHGPLKTAFAPTDGIGDVLAFSGDNYTDADAYLATQILDTLTKDDRDFLLDTAVLLELRADVADAVRERTDSSRCLARLAMLSPLVRQGTELMSVHVNPWLREFLLRRSRQDGVESTRGRHLRAASAYEARNDLVAAVDHAVAAGLPDFAAETIERRGATRLLTEVGVGRTRLLLSKLPPALRHGRPRLRLLHIAHLIVENNANEAYWDMESLRRDMAQAELGTSYARLSTDEVFQLEFAVVECLMLLNRAEHELVLSPWAELDRVTRMGTMQFCEDWRLLGTLIPLQILFVHRYGPLSSAARYIARIETMYRSEDSDYNMPWVRFNRARECVGSGHLDEAERILIDASDPRHAVSRFDQASFRNMVAALRARIAYLTGRIKLAASILDSIERDSAGLLLEVSAAIYVERARCCKAMGEDDAAMAQLDAADRLAATETLPHLGALSTCTRLVWLADAGRVDEMRSLASLIDLSTLWQTAAVPRALPWIDVEAIGRAMIRVALANHDIAVACTAADRLHTLAEQMEERPGIIQARLLRMRAFEAANKPKQARQALEAAVTMAAEGGISQPFIDEHIDVAWLNTGIENSDAVRLRLLARIRESQLKVLQMRLARDDRLTSRERDVMYWLAQGLATKEIGRELRLSPETVKQHLKTIFTKLDVNSRTAAVAAVYLERHRCDTA